jgi:hypothetical protein
MQKQNMMPHRITQKQEETYEEREGQRIFFIIINVDVWVSLRVLRLIPQILKLTTK